MILTPNLRKKTIVYLFIKLRPTNTRKENKKQNKKQNGQGSRYSIANYSGPLRYN